MQDGSCLVCFLSSWRKEGTTYIWLPFCGTANEQDHCLILWSVRSLYPTGVLQDFLHPPPRNRKKVLSWQHLLPGIAEESITSSPCRGLECKEPTKIFLSPRNRKKGPQWCSGNTRLPRLRSAVPAQDPMWGKLVVAYRWSAVYSTEP